jgi:hypothetical protein
VRKYYGKEWPDRWLYNLMINTKAGDEAVIATVLDAINLLDRRESSVRPAPPAEPYRAPAV